MPKLDAERLQRFLVEEGLDGRGRFVVEDVGEMTARVRLRATSRNLRPGGTLSGASLMALADLAIYAALLGEIGLVPLAVTTSLTINFLRKPPLADVLAEARLLKVGKSLAFGEIVLASEGDPRPVAHATSTYSIPPRPPA
ncbi:MAG: PaaI family thioesterase [Acidobacteriota bacterium]